MPTLPESARATLDWLRQRKVSSGLPRAHHSDLRERLAKIAAAYALEEPSSGWPDEATDGFRAVCDAVGWNANETVVHVRQFKKAGAGFMPPLPMAHEMDAARLERVIKALELMAEQLSRQKEEAQRIRAEGPRSKAELLSWCRARLTDLAKPDCSQEQHEQIWRDAYAYAAAVGADEELLEKVRPADLESLIVQPKYLTGQGYRKVTVRLATLVHWCETEAGLSQPPAPAAPLAPERHSPDFRSVHWRGADYVFTPTQAACVKILWQAWENGTPELGQAYILEHEEVDSESERLHDLFKDDPAWTTLIVKGTTAGSFRLGIGSGCPSTE